MTVQTSVQTESGAATPPVLYELDICVAVNTPDKKLKNNIQSALARDLPTLSMRPVKDKKLAICASGPSLYRTWCGISEDTDVMALNGAYKFLLANGRTPNYFAMLDARACNTNFLETPYKETEFLLALQCAPEVFDALAEFNTTTYALYTPLCRRLTRKIPGLMNIGAAGTIGLSALSLAAVLGYRTVELHGYDSSFENEERRVVAQPQNDGEITMDIYVEDRRYRTTPAMAQQVKDFRGYLAAVTEAVPDFTVDLMSGGLLRDYLATGQCE